MKTRTRIRSKLRREAGREDGAAAVEFALIVGLLAMLVFGMMEYGLAFMQVQTLRAATREGARVAAVAGTPTRDLGGHDRGVGRLAARRLLRRTRSPRRATTTRSGSRSRSRSTTARCRARCRTRSRSTSRCCPRSRSTPRCRERSDASDRASRRARSLRRARRDGRHRRAEPRRPVRDDGADDRRGRPAVQAPLDGQLFRRRGPRRRPGLREHVRRRRARVSGRPVRDRQHGRPGRRQRRHRRPGRMRLRQPAGT